MKSNWLVEFEFQKNIPPPSRHAAIVQRIAKGAQLPAHIGHWADVSGRNGAISVLPKKQFYIINWNGGIDHRYTINVWHHQKAENRG